jgi:arsenate reductase
MGIKRRVLFLCTGNSCRSQMAEGWLRALGGDRYDAFSAGTHPVGLNPGAVDVMREAGIDISSQQSTHLSIYIAQSFDAVITVCDRAKESCPRFPGGSTMLHWSFDDPAQAMGPPESRRQVFQRVRDEIRAKIEEFMRQDA